MRSLTLLTLLAVLTACASHAPLPTAPDRWTYLGNDPDGTQNIYMRLQGSDKKNNTVTAWYKFEFTSPRDVVTGPALKQQTYIERRDLVEVDCIKQTLRLMDETYYDVEDRQVFRVVPTAEAANANHVYAGGISDTVYEGACGNALQWDSLGQDPQKTQDIYARVQSPQDQQSIVKAVFRFSYHDPRQMVASPALTSITYSSRQSSVLMDCANQSFTVIHETYYDADSVTVFGVTPPKDAHPSGVVPDGVTGMMYKAACGIPLNWTYLGTDPRKTQKVFLVGAPEKKSGTSVEARFRFQYLAPGKLTTGA
ncbi:MAG: surface-adhesin E family protein, partial [Gammaproteobacteria bacterium]